MMLKQDQHGPQSEDSANEGNDGKGVSPGLAPGPYGFLRRCLKPIEYEKADPVIFVVCGLYLVAQLADETEEWESYSAGLLFVGLLLVYGISKNPIIFCVSLLAYMTEQAPSWPDMSNHGNIEMIIDGYILLCVLLRLLRPDKRRRGWRDVAAEIEEALKESVIPVMPHLFSLIYLFAGFHKLNWDFFSTPHGCAFSFTQRISRAWGMQINPGPSLNLVLGVLVIVWEAGGAFMVWSKNIRPYILAFVLFMHMKLSMAVFVDFSALVNVFVFIFVSLSLPRDVLLSHSLVARFETYMWINVIAALDIGLVFWLGGYDDVFHPIQAHAFIVSTAYFFFPLLKDMMRVSKATFTGFIEASKHVRVGGWLLAILFMLFFSSPYLGLRTCGVATMFSNLRTEGLNSNHMLLGSNPLKIFSYQEDLVTFDSCGKDVVTRSHLAGRAVPLVEVQKLVDYLSAPDNRTVTAWARFTYKNETVETEDIRTVDVFRQGKWWEKLTMEFRSIPADSRAVNKCSW